MDTESDNKRIGKIIAEKRTALGWSQDELAKRMGYTSRSTINKIEMGINSVTTTKAKKFAKVLGFSVCELLEDSPSESYTLYNQIKEDPRLQDAIQKYYKLDEISKAMVLAYIQAQYDQRNEETVKEMLENCVVPPKDAI